MPNTKSMMLAAQAWCTDKTRNKEVDPDLAMAFAEILDNQLEELRKENDKLRSQVDNLEEYIGSM